jgi:multidrug transporter EmrE-like cation transporter
MIVLLTTVGVVIFGERLSGPEIVGLVMALASLVLLVRFA